MRRFFDFVVYDEPPDPDADGPDIPQAPHSTSDLGLSSNSIDPLPDAPHNERANDQSNTNPQTDPVAPTGSLKTHLNQSPLDTSEIVSTDSTHTEAGSPESSVINGDVNNLHLRCDNSLSSSDFASGAFDTAPIVSDHNSVIHATPVIDAPVPVLVSAGIVEQDDYEFSQPHLFDNTSISHPVDSTSRLPKDPSNVRFYTNTAFDETVRTSLPNLSSGFQPHIATPFDELVRANNFKGLNAKSPDVANSKGVCVNSVEINKATPTNHSEGMTEECSRIAVAANVYMASPSDAQLRSLAEVLSEFTKRADVTTLDENRVWLGTPAAVVNALRELAEVMVWADQNDHSLWDTFMECAIMSLLVQCLETSVALSNEPKLTRNQMPNSVTANNGAGPVFQEELSTSFDTYPRQYEDVEGVTGEDQNRPSPDSAPLLTNQNASSEPEGSVNAEITTRFEEELQDASLQEIIVPFPTHSSSKPTMRSSELSKSALYDTFSLSNSSSSAPAAGDGSSAVKNIKPSLSNSCAIDVQSQVLQSLSITVQSVTRKESLFCIFSSNHINKILSFPFSFESEEMLGLLMSAIKTITLKLDHNLLQFFFDPKAQSFPLYSVVVRFYDHPDSMVRIAVRNITLALCAQNDSGVLEYVARDDAKYIHNTVALLKRLCGTVAHAFELLLDDGREVRRTRTRTGIFRRSVRISDVEDKLLEIENLCAYFGDMAEVSHSRLYSTISKLLGSDVFAPLFRPLASYASPEAINAMRRRRWGLNTGDVINPEVEPALPMFDAAARILLLAFILSCCKGSAVADSLVKELTRPAARFEGRHVFNALKSIAADVSGTERLTFVALLAMEGALNCDSMNLKMMSSLGYDFTPGCMLNEAKEEELEVETSDASDLVLSENVGNEGKQCGESGERDGDMLMTLHDFDVPTTPTVLQPMTPSLLPASPRTPTASSSLLFRSLSSSASLDESMWRSYAGDAGTFRKSIENGTASLQDVLSSIIVVVRRREVRTNRVLRSIVRIMFAVAERKWDWLSVASISREIIIKLATSLKAFVKSRNTTIVALERAFEHLREVSDDPSSTIDIAAGYKYVKNESPITTVEGTVRLASESPRGAGKRRRVGSDGIVSPIEEEDARSLFEFLGACELAAKKTPDRQNLNITEAVKGKLEGCGLEDSYLDKRDALEAMADAIITQPNLV